LDGTWKPWHRRQTDAALKIIAVVAALQYDQVVNHKTNLLGKGITKTSKIITKLFVARFEPLNSSHAPDDDPTLIDKVTT
jgi:hypothetical protein